MAFLGVTGPVLLFAAAAVAYALIYTGIELIILAAIIDAYFGYGGGSFYIYTLSTGIAMLIIQVLKPHLWMYQR